MKNYVWIPTVIIAGLIAVIIVFPNNPAHDLFLGYLTIIVSWPVVIFLVILILGVKFKDPIIDKLFKLSELGAGSLSLKFQEQPKPLEFDESVKRELEAQLESEKTETRKTMTELEKVKAQAAANFMFAGFEWMIRYMYRSQYLFLCAHVETGKASLRDAAIHYGMFEAAGGDSKFYPMTSYYDWLEKKQGLIKFDKENNELALTERGKIFIGYCGIMHYTKNDFKPL